MQAGKAALLVPAVLGVVTAFIRYKPISFLRRAWAHLSGQIVVLRAQNGAEAHILTTGCVIQRLIVPDKKGTLEDVVLGFDTLKPYAVCVATPVTGCT